MAVGAVVVVVLDEAEDEVEDAGSFVAVVDPVPVVSESALEADVPTAPAVADVEVAVAACADVAASDASTAVSPAPPAPSSTVSRLSRRRS
ncbi:MAG TPA: hypothetical protein VGL60_11660 [Acidimicrobiales bacterium]